MPVQIAFMSCVLLQPPATDCPVGAVYRSTVSPLAGAACVAWDGPTLIVGCPESLDSGAPGPQVVRCAPDARSAPVPIFDGLRSRLLCVADVAVSPSGWIAVADASGAVFVSEPGRPLDGPWREWGRGTLERPAAVAWSGDRLLVSDAAAGAVAIFAGDGTELARVGSGTLREPAGIAVDADGALFVADRLADCLWRFDSAGDGTYSPASVRLGESGSNPGQFSAPRDVVLLTRAERTCVLVADELNHRIQVVDRDGAFIGFFGMHALVPRQGEGRVHYPVGLALSPDATALAVAEAFEDRVQILALTDVPPEPDPALGSLTEVSSHFGAESAGGGDLYFAVDVETESIVVFAADRTPPIHIATIGGSGALPRRFGEVSAIALEPANPRIWVADRGRRRIDCFDIVRDPAAQLGLDQFIPRLAVSFDLAALSSRLPVEEDVAAWRVPEVVDIAFVPGAEGQTEVVLLDRANRALLRAGTRLENPRVEMLPSGPDGARRPEEIAIDGSVVFVTDPVARCVFRRDADGEWQRLDALGGEPFVRPAGVAVPWPGCVVVTDTARDCCIVHCDGDSQVIGERGGLDEQFYQPESIAATAFGWIVVDRGNHRFQRFATPAPGRFEWNLTGGLGRWFDRKRRGSPGGALRPGGDA